MLDIHELAVSVHFLAVIAKGQIDGGLESKSPDEVRKVLTEQRKMIDALLELTKPHLPSEEPDA